MKNKLFILTLITALFLSLFSQYGICEEIIEVTTAEEFINAIGPNRTIELAPGEYDLSSVEPREMEYVYWREEFDGYTIVIKNVMDLEIEGKGEEPVKLRVTPRYSYVLAFEEVERIELENLEMGHYPEAGYCTGGVVSVFGAREFEIEDCILFGCGTEGLTLESVLYFDVENTVIKDCTYGIMSITGSTYLTFKECEFVNNREFYGILISDCMIIYFNDCIIKGNLAASSWEASAGLIDIKNTSDVVITGGEIKGNTCYHVISPEESAELNDVEIDNNTLIKE